VSTTPADVTLGELWRQQDTMQRALSDVVAKLEALPDRIAADLDARSAERVEAFRREHDREHESVNLRHIQLAEKIRTVERAMWGVVVFALAGIGGALLNLVLGGPRK
jgi:hypothetical protein